VCSLSAYSTFADSLGVQEIDSLLRSIFSNPRVVTGSIPFRPGRNKVVLYRKNSDTDIGYLNDGYKSTPWGAGLYKVNPRYGEEFYIIHEDPKTHPVSKYIYTRGRGVVLHYCGENDIETAVDEMLGSMTTLPENCPEDLIEDEWLYSSTIDNAMQRITPFCVPSYCFTSLHEYGCTEIVLDWAKNNRIQDSTLVTVLDKGHYMLGAICKTQIFLFDPLFQSMKTYTPVFKTLNKIATVLSVFNKWNSPKPLENCIAHECGVQKNSTECGVHVLVNAFAIRYGFRLPQDDVFMKKTRNRAWICKLLEDEPIEVNMDKETEEISDETTVEFTDEDVEIKWAYFYLNKQYFQPLG